MNGSNLPPHGTPPITRNFGKVVRRHRLRLGMTQDKLAEKADVSPMCLHFIEIGRRMPQLATAERLADALGLLLPNMLNEALFENRKRD